MSVKEYIIIILIYISLTPSDIKHLFMGLITIWVCSSVNSLFILSALMSTASFIFFLFICRSYLHFTGINPLYDTPMPIFP